MTKNNRFSPAFEEGHFDDLVDEGEFLRQSLLYKQILPSTTSRPKTSVTSVARNLFNLRNLWLINDLRLCDGLYNCREKITNVVSALQIHLFLTNKPNFQKSQVERKYRNNKELWINGYLVN
jgi:hypothetical protein